MRLVYESLFLLFLQEVWCFPTVSEDSRGSHDLSRIPRAESKGIHVPIVSHRKVSGTKILLSSTHVGLGDYFDITYSVRLTVGGVSASFVFDSGSSDLWMLSDACADDCRRDAPAYPHTRLPSSALSIKLNYGDSQTGTYAMGNIAKDAVQLGTLSIQNQYFALINDTDTDVTTFDVSGIFGLGFPVNSIVWDQLLLHSEGSASQLQRRRQFSDVHASPEGNRVTSSSIPAFRRQTFPSLIPITHEGVQGRRTDAPSVMAALESYRSIGPFLPRLIEDQALPMPAFFTTLQRDSIDIGGNLGMLSIGEFPKGIRNESLTWVPLRGYTQDEAGLAAPPESPGEVYPIAWEVFLDGVYFDGEKLPDSRLSPGIKLSALVDTGNSLIRGPQDVVQAIQTKLGNDGLFDCSVPHTLAFSIGGKLFPVDPRDFISQAYFDDITHCTANLVPTDPPRVGGYQFAWSLGTPFLKGVFAAFYYGNLSFPSTDPPRMGFLSTVPKDADSKLKAAISVAAKADQNFPTVIETAPTGTDLPAAVNTGGVPQAAPRIINNDARQTRRTNWTCLGVLALAFGAMMV